MNKLSFLAMSTFLIFVGAACSSGSSSSSGSSGSTTDLTGAELTTRTTGCANYAGTYTSSITDSNNNTAFSGSTTISSSGSTCTVSTNSIPNHDVDSSIFATALAEVSKSYTLSASPSDAASTTDVETGFAQGILLSGVKIDVFPDACYGTGNGGLGTETSGCGADDVPWRYDPVYSGNTQFGADSNNAHTQPSGEYHYHGDPLTLYDNSNPNVASGLIGFAADGYPIFGPYIEDGSTVREVESGYTLKAGARANQAGEFAFPGGNYDGTFRDDYEWTDAGDLDECNGMEDGDGNYGYYTTRDFPYTVNCFKGTPDNSFGP